MSLVQVIRKFATEEGEGRAVVRAATMAEFSP